MRPLPRSLLALATLLIPVAVFAAEPRRPVNVDDINALRGIGSPEFSPDGEWIAYTVQAADLAKDKSITHVWMASWDGKRNIQLTYSDASEHTPHWSPDGKSLAFLTARGSEDGPDRLWLLDRTGGEAKPLTSFKGDVLAYDWSPDGKRLALIVADEDPGRKKQGEENKTPPPIVIDRFYFKEDKTGYMGALRRHLYVFDVATRKADLLTPGRFDEGWPAWSPDGNRIAFVSNRSPDPDRNNTFGIYTIEPHAGAMPQLVTNFEGEAGDSSWMSGPVWRPDGREIAFVGAGDPKLIYYSTHHLAVVSATGGQARVLTPKLDRNVLAPKWSRDGKSLYFLVEDDRNQLLSKLTVASGKIARLMAGRRDTSEFDLHENGRLIVLDSSVDTPYALYAVEGRKTRVLTHQNDEWLAGVKLGTTDEISFASKDGTRIGGFVVKPPDYVPGRRYPTLLSIHGGPVSQFANTFSMAWQIYGGHGYVVVAANPRGSSGRGQDFATAIYAEWVDKDTDDVLAAVDHAVQTGIADPDRLGVGGWSYGGILTNYVISKDTRFKSATSGASISNILAGYGTDMYIREYEAELGRPWEKPDVWLRNSYAFLHVDRIKTPTLFLCGDKDFNVPLLNSEQMYQALRSLGIDTQLIIYPGEYHGLTKPSYLHDRMQRYLDWHGKYLKTAGGGAGPHRSMDEHALHN